jgi:predicted amidohydrolase
VARTLRVSCVELTSGAGKASNLATAERLVARAAAAGADVVVLPDAARLEDVRARLPSLAGRRPNAYRWPASV